MTDREALAMIADYPDRLVTPFHWQSVVEKIQDMAAHQLGWREGQTPLPDLKHKETT